jgi:NADH-quinone oxidoreductase subunit G
VPFVVSLEQRRTDVTDRADVVFPVAAVTEKAGSYLDWEGRHRPFAQVMPDSLELPDGRVLGLIAEELDAKFGRGDTASLSAELAALAAWTGERAPAPSVPAGSAAQPGAGEAVLATWRPLLDAGQLQVGDPYLAATARPVVARLSAATASAAGIDGDGPATVTLATDAGELTLPVELTAMPDGVVWVPERSDGSDVRAALGAGAGDLVRLTGESR